MHSDWTLVAIVFCLVVVGLVFVYSASCYSAKKDFGDQFYFLKKQLSGALVGVVAMV